MLFTASNPLPETLFFSPLSSFHLQWPTPKAMYPHTGVAAALTSAGLSSWCTSYLTKVFYSCFCDSTLKCWGLAYCLCLWGAWVSFPGARLKYLMEAAVGGSVCFSSQLGGVLISGSLWSWRILPWRQACEAAGHLAPAVRKQREVNSSAQFMVSFFT